MPASYVATYITVLQLVPIVTDRPEVRYLNRYVREPLCAVGAKGPDKWHDLGLVLMGAVDIG